MTMMQKAVLAGVGVLAVGLATGYGAGIVKERSDTDWGRGGMMRDGYGNGKSMMKNDDGRGLANRDGSGYGKGQGTGQMRGQGMGQGTGMMGGRGPGEANRSNCVSDECLYVDDLEYPAGELTDAAKSALLTALDDEYKVLATYEAVMAKIGAERPFVMIARAEEQHVAALKGLFDKYGVAIPTNPYTGKVSVPDTKEAACQAGVDAEIADANLYRDKLLPVVKEYPDITGVLTNLMNASQERHLPAFDRCN